MISNEEYEQNIKFFDNKEKKKSSLFKKRIFNVFGNGNNNNFLKMIQNPINFYGNEKKIYEKSINDGIYNIIPMHCNNRAIEIYYGSTENMANLHLYEYNNTKAQQFEVKYNSENNYYTIKCLCSNKLLTVDYNNKNNIIQKDEKKTFEQQWFIVKKGNNYEICVYTRYKDCCFLIILTAHDEKSITDNISNMEYIINNMIYMDAQVEN